MANIISALIGVLLDRLFGEPKYIWSRLPHPVVLMGWSIAVCDTHYNRANWSDASQLCMGIVCLTTLTLAWTGSAACVLFLPDMIKNTITAGMAGVLIAHRSLTEHVQDVAYALKSQECDAVEGGRLAVSRIVGRDPDTLDKDGICRAAIESGAENFSDGFIAPLCWLLIFGLPGLVFYKLINTADSMIGHRSIKYKYFGWAAARTDDILNWIPARLSALILIMAIGVSRLSKQTDWSLKKAWRIWRHDAGRHKSPNAGHPESVMAGALNIALAGPRTYAGVLVPDPFLNTEGDMDLSHHHIEQSIRLLDMGWIIAVILLSATAGLMLIWP